MRSTLDEFTKEISELRALVASIAPVNLALSAHQDLLVQQYVSIRRRFDNAAFVVALYASFEKFIENLICAYSLLEARRVKYSELPNKLLAKHLQRSAELLYRGRLGEGRYSSLSAENIIKNLFDCLHGINPYLLNEAAVVAHDVNLRADEIDKLFSIIGIDQICNRILGSDVLVDWYANASGLDFPPTDGVQRVVIEERLKNLIERRNEAAHRGGNPVDLLGAASMSETIDFVESFGRSVFSIIVGQYLENFYSGSPHRFELTQRQDDGPFKNGKIVVIEKPGQRLFVGQPVFVIIESAGARWGRVQSLMLDDEVLECVDSSTNAPQGVGVGLDFKCPKGAVLIALTSDDDLVWSPQTVAA